MLRDSRVRLTDQHRRGATLIEALEGRQLLSGSHHGGGGGFGHGHGGGGGAGAAVAVTVGQLSSTIQAGLDALAVADGLTAPADTQEVLLGNNNGVETYSVVYNTTGTITRITVDQGGNAVNAPTRTTATFDTIASAASGTEITAIAAARGLTAPTATTSVAVTTSSDGAVTYSVSLAEDSTSTTGRHHDHGTTISVDANGFPVGNQVLPFSVLPAAIQSALNANAPTGATALATDSTQLVSVQTLDGVTLYSTSFTTNGTTTTVTVNKAGALASLPSKSSTTFAEVPAAAQSALQTLATANGVTATIASDQSVSVYNQANGNVLYSASLSSTSSSGSTLTLILTVDAAGNPTVRPDLRSFARGEPITAGDLPEDGGAGCDDTAVGTVSVGDTSSSSSSGSSTTPTTSGSSTTASDSAATTTVAATTNASTAASLKAAKKAAKAEAKAAKVAAKAAARAQALAAKIAKKNLATASSAV